MHRQEGEQWRFSGSAASGPARLAPGIAHQSRGPGSRGQRCQSRAHRQAGGTGVWRWGLTRQRRAGSVAWTPRIPGGRGRILACQRHQDQIRGRRRCMIAPDLFAARTWHSVAASAIRAAGPGLPSRHRSCGTALARRLPREEANSRERLGVAGPLRDPRRTASSMTNGRTGSAVSSSAAAAPRQSSLACSRTSPHCTGC